MTTAVQIVRDGPEKDAAPADKEEDGWQREVKRIAEILERRCNMMADPVDADGNCILFFARN